MPECAKVHLQQSRILFFSGKDRWTPSFPGGVRKGVETGEEKGERENGEGGLEERKERERGRGRKAKE